MKSVRKVPKMPILVVAAVLVAVGLISVPLAAQRGTASTFSPNVTARTIVHPAAATTCPAGSGPGFPGYDPVNHDVYVPNENSGNLTVISATCHRVGSVTLPFGAEPISAAFDPANNEMYVTDDSLNQVYAISGLVVKSTITSSQITAPREIIWDPGDSMMLLTNDFGFYSVVGVQGTSVIGSVGVGSDPQGLCYDPFFNTILVVNVLSENVTVLNAYSPLGSSIGNFGVGFDPQACVFDVADNHDYITNLGDDNVTVAVGSGTVLGSVNVGSLPGGIGWDQATLQVYVVDTLHGGISVISGFSVVKTLHPVLKSGEGMTFDQANNEMYIASFTGDDVVVQP